ncbi:MAG: prolyl oligopeptidase family serine peptidase, partial [Myxococcota bacterium]
FDTYTEVRQLSMGVHGAEWAALASSVDCSMRIVRGGFPDTVDALDPDQVDIVREAKVPVSLAEAADATEPDPAAGSMVGVVGSSDSTELNAPAVQSAVCRRSSAERITPTYFAKAQKCMWHSADQTEVYGFYYPPTSPDYTSEGLPPVLVDVHGGPTAQRNVGFSAETALFTSRGWGVFVLNYRGSTGYGRTYREALNHRWGILDVEDAVGAAHMLCERKLADPRRLVIRGGSAGGYTVLQTLVQHPGVFCAGVCLYGISNLFTLAQGTHKFESRYLDRLIGCLPQDAERYHQRSPLFFAEQIQDPLAIFQGDQDQVVPPEQAESLVRTLRARNIPHHYRLFVGEGHGWRKPETWRTYYQELLNFLQQFVLYAH